MSKYMYNPGKGHWQDVKWILRYLEKIVDVSLIFEQDKILGKCLVRYVGSDYVGDLDKRQSTIGIYLLLLEP